jgi:hypothetical protein
MNWWMVSAIILVVLVVAMFLLYRWEKRDHDKALAEVDRLTADRDHGLSLLERADYLMNAPSPEDVRAAERARIRAAVEALPNDWGAVNRAAVLALTGDEPTVPQVNPVWEVKR